MALAKLAKIQPRITQIFGNVLVYNGVNIYAQSWLNWHNGIDYGTANNTILLATIDWLVEVVNSGKYGYWLHIKIFKKREDWITEVIYWHLNKSKVKTGDIVKVWDIIGWSWWLKTSPTSGTSTGAHLHFWLRFRTLQNVILNENNWYKWWIDPLPYF